MSESSSPSLAEALSSYSVNLKPEDQRVSQLELNRFVQWCGRDRRVGGISPHEVASYGETASLLSGDTASRLKHVKAFLTFMKKSGFTEISLAPHLKAIKGKGRNRLYFKTASEQAELSEEGMANLQSRLGILKEERIKVVDDIKKAMADKDFRENAPLDAAKERQGMIESNIREIEAVLANAVATETKPVDDKRVRLGKKVTLKEAATGKKVSYVLVDSREADPASGKISSASPVGKALLDRTVGDDVQIAVPRGTLRYTVEQVER